MFHNLSQSFTKNKPSQTFTNSQKQELLKNMKEITIPKIELEEYFYQQDSQENTIEKHVSILGESILPNEENSITNGSNQPQPHIVKVYRKNKYSAPDITRMDEQ